jgi:lysophospholipase L1-like esterase
LAIGDSHGAVETGWVSQLQKLRPADSIMNVAVSGNTIGFDNLGRESLNELKNIQNQLLIANEYPHSIDYIIVMLGTNDCKAVFDSMQSEIPVNYDKLIESIKSFSYTHSPSPTIIVVTPPPIAEDELMEAKYHGAKSRLEKNLPFYHTIAIKYDFIYVDANTPLQKNFREMTKDGIHLTDDGYVKVATLINQKMQQ